MVLLNDTGVKGGGEVNNDGACQNDDEASLNTS